MRKAPGLRWCKSCGILPKEPSQCIPPVFFMKKYGNEPTISKETFTPKKFSKHADCRGTFETLQQGISPQKLLMLAKKRLRPYLGDQAPLPKSLGTMPELSELRIFHLRYKTRSFGFSRSCNFYILRKFAQHTQLSLIPISLCCILLSKISESSALF